MGLLFTFCSSTICDHRERIASTLREWSEVFGSDRHFRDARKITSLHREMAVSAIPPLMMVGG
ncbi:hypothetical protein [Bacteroides ovatus]|uniref:hypothetical protein n=1 Tax=Bacteroides ovatus TaxID=28116 RepID=UPI00319DF3CE